MFKSYILTNYCLRIKCENNSHGCSEIIRLDNLVDHVLNCEFNPKRPVRCEECHISCPKNELPTHNCIRDLRKQGSIFLTFKSTTIFFSFSLFKIFLVCFLQHLMLNIFISSCGIIR